MIRQISYVVVAAMTAMAAPRDKVSPDLNAKSGSSVDVIVQFAQEPGNSSLDAVKAKGATLKGVLKGAKASVFTLPASSLETVASLPDVAYISPDRMVEGQLDYSAWGVNAPLAWTSGWTGNGIGIAIIDSGISQSPDLGSSGNGSNRVVYSESFGRIRDGVDRYGHGTHVSGIAAGDGGREAKYKGIAPKAQIINLRVLDENGVGTDSAVISAIFRAIELKSRYNIRVINLSLGRPVYESYKLDPLCQAAEAAWKAGIVVVAAAGNDGRNNFVGNRGYGTINAPGNDPYVITVGAMKTMGTYARNDDQIASYSSKGPTAIDHIVKPDLVAPGNQVVSTIGTGSHTLTQSCPGITVGKEYVRLSGTSMATPVVAGAAALLLEKNPSLTPDQVKARLMKTASKQFPASSVAVDPPTALPTSAVTTRSQSGQDISMSPPRSKARMSPQSRPGRLPPPSTRKPARCRSSKMLLSCGAPALCGVPASYGVPQLSGVPRSSGAPQSYGVPRLSGALRQCGAPAWSGVPWRLTVRPFPSTENNSRISWIRTISPARRTERKYGLSAPGFFCIEHTHPQHVEAIPFPLPVCWISLKWREGALR